VRETHTHTHTHARNRQHPRLGADRSTGAPPTVSRAQARRTPGHTTATQPQQACTRANAHLLARLLPQLLLARLVPPALPHDPVAEAHHGVARAPRAHLLPRAVPGGAAGDAGARARTHTHTHTCVSTGCANTCTQESVALLAQRDCMTSIRHTHATTHTNTHAHAHMHTHVHTHTHTHMHMHMHTHNTHTHARTHAHTHAHTTHTHTRATPGGVVRRGVVPAAVRHRLDDDWAPVLERDAPRLLCRTVHGTRVAAVHANSWHAVGWSAARDAVALVLLVRGRADRVAVVPAAACVCGGGGACSDWQTRGGPAQGGSGGVAPAPHQAHTQPHTATHSHTQPHTQPHTATHSHTQPHTHAHTHTQPRRHMPAGGVPLPRAHDPLHPRPLRSPADEEAGRAQRGRKVDGCVEVALAGSTLPKVGHSHGVGLAQLCGASTQAAAAAAGSRARLMCSCVCHGPHARAHACAH
jgi:hypothetical protein